MIELKKKLELTKLTYQNHDTSYKTKLTMYKKNDNKL